MTRKPQKLFARSSARTSTPIAGAKLQRKCACGGSCAECAGETQSARSLWPFNSEVNHDFRNVGVFAGDGSAAVVQDQTPTQSGGLGDEYTQNVPPESTMKPTTELDSGNEGGPKAPVIDSVEMVTSSSGAAGGFPAITCDASLDQPGPYNDHWAKGSVANVQQVHFHLSQGWPGDLRVNRQVNRTATTAKKPNDTKTGWDGPPDHEILTTKDKLVVADAPGFCATATEADFPVTYTGDFSLYAFDPLHMNILASIAYHIEISKQSFGQIDPVNTITVTDKKVGGTVKSPVPPKQK